MIANRCDDYHTYSLKCTSTATKRLNMASFRRTANSRRTCADLPIRTDSRSRRRCAYYRSCTHRYLSSRRRLRAHSQWRARYHRPGRRRLRLAKSRRQGRDQAGPLISSTTRGKGSPRIEPTPREYRSRGFSLYDRLFFACYPKPVPRADISVCASVTANKNDKESP